ncbi:rhodanese-like domain-containing protein [Lysinimonas soli]|uniref:Rhodanese-like domain-containing protein n=1 Tax=Lysinimonas soli TaxID=1074233 RepID=A0ABW0NRL7_9MICO
MSIFSRLFAKPFATVDGATARRIVEEGGLLVDVRSIAEWNAGHAPAATHLPLESVEQRAHRLPSGVHLVTVCKSGMRSASAARILAAKGYEVSSVRGGMSAWRHAGGRVVNKNGREGTV